MVRANFKQSTLLENLDTLFEDGGNIYIKPPFNKYYRVSDPVEIADLEGMDVVEFENFEAEDPVREYINVVGYAIAKDEYRDQIEETSGLIYADIGEDGKLYYNVSDRVFEIETDDLGINYDEMGREIESEVVKSPSKNLKEDNVLEPAGPVKEAILKAIKELSKEHHDYMELEDILDEYGLPASYYDEAYEETAPLAPPQDDQAMYDNIEDTASYIIDKLKKDYLSESENLTEDESKDNEPAEYYIEWAVYDRYGSGDEIKKTEFKAKTLKDAVKKVVSRLGLYLEPEDIDDRDEYNGDARAAIESIEESNGDGCDYIMIFKNNTTGEVYIKGDWSPEDDNWDDDLDESEKAPWSHTAVIYYGTTDDQGDDTSEIEMIVDNRDEYPDITDEALHDAFKNDNLDIWNNDLTGEEKMADIESLDETFWLVYKGKDDSGKYHFIIDYANTNESDNSIKEDDDEVKNQIYKEVAKRIARLDKGKYLARDAEEVIDEVLDSFNRQDLKKELMRKYYNDEYVDSRDDLKEDDNTSTIYIDLSEIISYAEKYISGELKKNGGSDVKITTAQDGQYMVTLNKGDNSIKAYCDLGIDNADEELEENRSKGELKEEVGYNKEETVCS